MCLFVCSGSSKFGQFIRALFQHYHFLKLTHDTCQGPFFSVDIIPIFLLQREQRFSKLRVAMRIFGENLPAPAPLKRLLGGVPSFAAWLKLNMPGGGPLSPAPTSAATRVSASLDLTVKLGGGGVPGGVTSSYPVRRSENKENRIIENLNICHIILALHLFVLKMY